MTETGAETESDGLERVYFTVIGIFNPMSISMAVFFFGASGLATLRYLPALAPISYMPAICGAIISTGVLQNMLSWFAGKLENSVTNSLSDAIGTSGEITVTIPKGGKTGEVMFVLGQGRRNYSARAIDPEKEIKRGTRVLIIDLESNFVYVEPVEEPASRAQ